MKNSRTKDKDSAIVPYLKNLASFFSLCLLTFYSILWQTVFSNFLSAEETVIKFATLAPEGSSWMNVLEDWNRELIEKSGGKLKFKIYSGGISGDEKDVVRKIRLGQLHGGGFTGVGLGEIAPKVRILDSPFLFEKVEEVDHIYQKFEKEWEGAFRERGYIFLGWAEVGFVYFFTGQPIQKLSELKGTKMWMWEGDPIAEVTFKSIGVHATPLSITDVMTSLQTGLIDGVYSSPLALIALQWFTRTKYMYDLHLANASGAVLVSKPFFDKMPKNLQELLLVTGKKQLNRLTQISRAENKSAIETLKKNGIKIIAHSSGPELEEYRSLGQKARRMLVNRLYQQDFLDQIEKELEQFRKLKKKSKL